MSECSCPNTLLRGSSSNILLPTSGLNYFLPLVTQNGLVHELAARFAARGVRVNGVLHSGAAGAGDAPAPERIFADASAAVSKHSVVWLAHLELLQRRSLKA